MKKSGGGRCWDLSGINTESTEPHYLLSRFKASRTHQAHKGRAGSRLLKVNVVQDFCRCGITNYSESQCSVQQRAKSIERTSTEQHQKPVCSPIMLRNILLWPWFHLSPGLYSQCHQIHCDLLLGSCLERISALFIIIIKKKEGLVWLRG